MVLGGGGIDLLIVVVVFLIGIIVVEGYELYEEDIRFMCIFD